MHCPNCGNTDTKVVDSRIGDEGASIKRRRICESCGFRFTTFEKRSVADFFVSKRDGSVEYYDRQKLLKSISIACVKRPIGIDQIEHVIRELETLWMNTGTTISSTKIGTDVLERLKEIDTVSYIRFASVYGEFATITDFQKIINAAEDEKSGG